MLPAAPSDKGLERSRGNLTCKIHLAVRADAVPWPCLSLPGRGHEVRRARLRLGSLTVASIRLCPAPDLRRTARPRRQTGWTPSATLPRPRTRAHPEGSNNQCGRVRGFAVPVLCQALPKHPSA
ncbi:hypothetical protein GCM10010343_30010 [Streptomyces avidinii]|nr:hypothetical protein GCM10010343_30010 [Streptomyces avidinii]